MFERLPDRVKIAICAPIFMAACVGLVLVMALAQGG